MKQVWFDDDKTDYSKNNNSDVDNDDAGDQFGSEASKKKMKAKQ
jgi:hypothetical protein